MVWEKRRLFYLINEHAKRVLARYDNSVTFAYKAALEIATSVVSDDRLTFAGGRYLTETNLPTRIVNLLIRNNIFTVEELLRTSAKELLEIPGIGPHYLEIIMQFVEQEKQRQSTAKGKSNRQIP